MQKVEIYTDGSCLGNPGPGGYGIILVCQGHEKEISEYVADSNGNPVITTNNVAELMGVIVGLRVLNKPCEVVVTTDSSYVVNAFNKGWLAKWQRNGWKGDKNKPIKNKELWVDLLGLTQKHQVTFVHIEGHAGHHYNERCDVLAKAASQEAKSILVA